MIDVALITAVVTLATAIVGYLTRRIHKEVREIHIMVNSRMDKAMARIDQLLETLRDAEVAVPDHPSADREAATRTVLSDFDDEDDG